MSQEKATTNQSIGRQRAAKEANAFFLPPASKTPILDEALRARFTQVDLDPAFVKELKSLRRVALRSDVATSSRR